MVKLKRNKLIGIIIIISILILACLFSTIFSIINLNSSKILKGISINGIDVSNMTKEKFSHPSEIVAVGDIVEVWVKKIDEEKQKVQLTMIEA